MNKKLITPIVVGVAVLVGLGVFVAVSGSETKPVNSNKEDHGASDDKHYEAVKACDVFTLAEAKEVLGESATVGTNTAPAGSEDNNVDTCSYTNNSSDPAAIKVATVVVRSAKSKVGTKSNTAAFDAGAVANPAGAESVSGYGEKAYWDSTLKQLNILQEHGHQWVTIVHGDADPANNTLADAKLVADKVEN